MAVTRRSLLLGAAALPAAAQIGSRQSQIPPSGLLPAAQSPEPYRSSAWKVVYAVDEDRMDFEIIGLQFASPRTGFVAGRLMRDGRLRESRLLVTVDAGATWKPVKLRDQPLSLFALNERHLWVVTGKGLLFSADAGATLTKLKLPKNCVRVCFGDPANGFAFGIGKVFWRTQDGGKSWAKVRESETAPVTDEFTVYRAMSFVTPQVAILGGNSKRPEIDEEPLPDWMQPERAATRRAKPATTLTFGTRDGGKTWNPAITSAFGSVIQIRTRGSVGASLLFYGDGFAWPSELILIDLSTGKSAPAFRMAGLRVTDVTLLPDAGAILAGIDPLGRLTSAGLPGKTKFLYTPDFKLWYEMKSDYRAEGANVLLAHDGANGHWAATSSGMILRLVK